MPLHVVHGRCSTLAKVQGVLSIFRALNSFIFRFAANVANNSCALKSSTLEHLAPRPDGVMLEREVMHDHPYLRRNVGAISVSSVALVNLQYFSCSITEEDNQHTATPPVDPTCSFTRSATRFAASLSPSRGLGEIDE